MKGHLVNKKQSQSGSAHLLVIILLVVSLLGALGYIYYLNFMQPKAAEVKPAPVVVVETLPTAETVSNIKAAISSGNTAALSGYMLDTVAVICIPCGIVPTEGETIDPATAWDQTKEQAILTITNKCSKSEGTWDFNLDQAKIMSYTSPAFKDAVKSNSIIGKSSISGDIILLNFDTAGKITTVITSNEKFLIEI